MAKSQKSFRLKSLKLSDSEIFEAGDFAFIQDDFIENGKHPFTTLIIGANGTGKSRLLKIIIDIFNDLYNFKKVAQTDFKFNQYYQLKYLLNGKEYEISNKREGLLILVNGERKYLNSLVLPEKGIAAAYSFYEKFTPKENSYLKSNNRTTRYENDFYEYLGMKTNRNYTFSSAIINNSIDLITSALSKKGFEKDLKEVFNVLGFLPKITITYRVTKNRELFSGKITSKNIKKILSNINYKSAGFSFNSLQNLQEATPREIGKVVKSLNESSKVLGERYNLPVDVFFDTTGNEYFTSLYIHLTTIRSLNLINYDKIFVYKKVKNNPDGQRIDLRSMSSGEIQILTSLLSLASVVKDNSLILIDEPEISLHPNWQMQYIDLLNKIFKSYKSCHFIIATHSHLMASDIPIESSAILSLKRNLKLELISELLDSTYGLSAENILYNVFGVASVRNFYFESDINKLLDLISNKSNRKVEIQSLITKFKKFKIPANDPLAIIIKDAETYFKKTWN